MKKLLLTAVLGLTLSLPVISHAGVNVFGVETPITKNQVSDNLTNGYVASDLGDTFHIQKLSNSDSSTISVNSEDRLLVFGVDINSIDKI